MSALSGAIFHDALASHFAIQRNITKLTSLRSGFFLVEMFASACYNVE